MASPGAPAVDAAPSVVLPLSGDPPQAADRNPPLQLSSSEGDAFRSREGSPRHILLDAEPGAPGGSPPRDFFMSPTSERFGNADLHRNGSTWDGEQPLPPLPPVRLMEPSIRRHRTVDTLPMMERKEEKQNGIGFTVGERLQPTIDVALAERDKYVSKAKMTGYALNAAIGMQVLLGSLTTGLSAVATAGRSAAVQTTILGALSTIVASYLARARGSNEPELSITRTKDLEQFIRECRAFQLDNGHCKGDQYDNRGSQSGRFSTILGRF
ncbi:unnamed protein product [Cyclocybe aegerita]|uniref:SMODS and SLOG-associating 2TM effector domain-containing protein n=1 Tax=Cyclocybe aegerita TaxID=1973307 RepID=A0A8S0WHA3_CYCAE|nr:unnamed protein product [Cyclocybe aegerita]